jgi:hypothetical protein
MEMDEPPTSILAMRDWLESSCRANPACVNFNASRRSRS